MVNRSITKLIDQAIIPATFLIVGKMAGLALAILFFHLRFSVTAGSFIKILPTVRFTGANSYILAESYSNLAMFIVAALGTIFVITRAHFLHESHISPAFQAKLARLNLESLISTSYRLYYQAAIWVTFLWLATAFLVMSTVLNVTYGQFSVIAFIVAANFSWIFVLDVEREMEIQRS
jgi:hypothetical protein